MSQCQIMTKLTNEWMTDKQFNASFMYVVCRLNYTETTLVEYCEEDSITRPSPDGGNHMCVKLGPGAHPPKNLKIKIISTFSYLH